MHAHRDFGSNVRSIEPGGDSAPRRRGGSSRQQVPRRRRWSASHRLRGTWGLPGRPWRRSCLHSQQRFFHVVLRANHALLCTPNTLMCLHTAGAAAGSQPRTAIRQAHFAGQARRAGRRELSLRSHCKKCFGAVHTSIVHAATPQLRAHNLATQFWLELLTLLSRALLRARPPGWHSTPMFVDERCSRSMLRMRAKAARAMWSRARRSAYASEAVQRHCRLISRSV